MNEISFTPSGVDLVVNQLRALEVAHRSFPLFPSKNILYATNAHEAILNQPLSTTSLNDVKERQV
jgi:hypothetical protein